MSNSSRICELIEFQKCVPRHSMYGIFTYISLPTWLVFMVNVYKVNIPCIASLGLSCLFRRLKKKSCFAICLLKFKR